MIKVSTKTRYALRALLEMAGAKEKKLFLLKDLAQHQNISRKYLENIFHALRRHNIVYSKVGKNGGFYLPSDIKAISVLKILEALEGKVDIVDCRKEGRKCERILFCPSRGVWQGITAAIKELLAAQNLKDLSER